MNIKKNQFYKRKKYTDNQMYYPEKGWKVIVESVTDTEVVYVVVEYDGSSSIPSTKIKKSVNEFESMYEPD